MSSSLINDLYKKKGRTFFLQIWFDHTVKEKMQYLISKKTFFSCKILNKSQKMRIDAIAYILQCAKSNPIILWDELLMLYKIKKPLILLQNVLELRSHFYSSMTSTRHCHKSNFSRLR